jgi:hypothetical protein
VLCKTEKGTFLASALREHGSLELALVERLRTCGWRLLDVLDNMAHCIRIGWMITGVMANPQTNTKIEKPPVRGYAQRQDVLDAGCAKLKLCYCFTSTACNGVER